MTQFICDQMNKIYLAQYNSNEYEYLCSSSKAPCYTSLPLLLQWKVKQQIKQNQQQIIMGNYKSTGSL